MEDGFKLSDFQIRVASKKVISLILTFIKELAKYEKSSNEFSTIEEILKETLFGEKR